MNVGIIFSYRKENFLSSLLKRNFCLSSTRNSFLIHNTNPLFFYFSNGSKIMSVDTAPAIKLFEEFKVCDQIEQRIFLPPSGHSIFNANEIPSLILSKSIIFLRDRHGIDHRSISPPVSPPFVQAAVAKDDVSNSQRLLSALKVRRDDGSNSTLWFGEGM